nr:amino acid transporter AVT1J-like [Onthophagus taurus]
MPQTTYNSMSSQEPIWTQVVCDPESPFSDSENEIKIRMSNKSKGLSVLATAIFIAGEMAGSGVLALPKAVVDSGWIGIILLIVFCFNAGYSGSCLGACWYILEERYPELRRKTRNPYGTIAQKSFGKYARYLVSGCIQFTLCGAGTVYLLLASQIIQELLNDILPSVSYCYWFLLIAALLLIPMWLESPKDFRAAGVIAISTTTIACILFFSQTIKDGLSKTEPIVHYKHDFSDFFLAFGTLLFAFGGASTFPTIQNDMQDKKKFGYSIVIAFSVIIALYLPVALSAYYVYGEDLFPNVAMSISKSIPLTIGNICMAVHLVFAFLIVINPVCQELEEIFKVPHVFCWQRCLLRSFMMIFMVFVGESIPQFGKILSLVGGSTITLLTFVFPPIFYMKLCSQKSEQWPERKIPGYIKVYLWELILIGILGGGASTYTAITDIFGPGSLIKPCYLPDHSQ